MRTNKLDIVYLVGKTLNLPQDQVLMVIDDFLEKIKTDLMEGNEVMLTGFGRFEIHCRKGGIGQNPKTGSRVKYGDRYRPHFLPSKGFKDEVNRLFRQKRKRS